MFNVVTTNKKTNAPLKGYFVIEHAGDRVAVCNQFGQLDLQVKSKYAEQVEKAFGRKLESRWPHGGTGYRGTLKCTVAEVETAFSVEWPKVEQTKPIAEVKSVVAEPAPLFELRSIVPQAVQQPAEYKLELKPIQQLQQMKTDVSLVSQQIAALTELWATGKISDEVYNAKLVQLK